jgi:DNA-binding transcriptional LysR family regulator
VRLENEFIGQRIKLQHLKVIMAVADWGSMQKAARHLAISQPVVSKVIAEVEHLLGVRHSPRGRHNLREGSGRSLRSGADRVRLARDR